MITCENGEFRLSTQGSAYWFRVTPHGQLEHVHYGALLPLSQPMEPLALKRTAVQGATVAYDPSDPAYSLDTVCLEWSGIGMGDYRETPMEIRMPDGTFTTDFRYAGHEITPGPLPAEGLPTAQAGVDACQTLRVELLDESTNVRLWLTYTVFEATDVITRRVTLHNGNEQPLEIRRLLSAMVDMPNDGFRLITLDGAWIKEAHAHERPLTYGAHVIGSVTGASGNRHNPGFVLAAQGTGESYGAAYGFNLVYSGNHYGEAELSARDQARVALGIHPQCFAWTLRQGERFETPEAVLCYSGGGLNGLSQRMHAFVNAHIVRGLWQGEERPVLANSWEACFFRFTRGKLLRLARSAKRLGVELFVLDDGWFQGRDNDRAGLGDYAVNRRKLPRGLAELARRIHRMGMKFGLWFEPEMVNPDSDLYRAHPEYALHTPGKRPAMGRNQLVLDLCNPAVRDYIVSQLGRVLDECGVDYVKWDFNRPISDACSPCLQNQGEFYHRYVLGLYEVLGRIFGPRPHILLESCASGGNRFDLGMLCFSPQIWASDDTDPIERLAIQGGLSLLYPLSAMGAHVSQAPHQQTLRGTPLATRFNVAAFGCLGYEMDLQSLTPVQRREIRRQIALYKEKRRLFQYGTFWRGEGGRGNQTVWHCVRAEAGEAVSGFFQEQVRAADGFDRLRIPGLAPGERYQVRTLPQSLFISRFGELVKHILPAWVAPGGWLLRMAERRYSLNDCVETYEATGEALAGGLLLNDQFMGTGYNEHIRLLGDFGSNLYCTERLPLADAQAVLAAQKAG